MGHSSKPREAAMDEGVDEGLKMETDTIIQIKILDGKMLQRD